MTEQDAFDEILRYGAAIHGDEWHAGAVALALDGKRDQLLADAAFAFDEDGYFRPARAPAQIDDTVHGLSLGDQIAECEFAGHLAVDPGDLAFQRVDPQRVLDRHFEPLRADRLDHEIGGAGAHRADCGIDAAIGRLHDDRRRGGVGTQPVQNAHTIEARHHQIQQYQVNLRGFLPAQKLKRLLTALRSQGLMSECFDGFFEDTPLDGIVIDDQDTLDHYANSLFLTVTPLTQTGPLPW